MKIAFLGKGGSGKSTLAAMMVQYLCSKGHYVLAIDADHNMDLSYELGVTSPTRFLGSDTNAVKDAVGVERALSFRDAQKAAESGSFRFSLRPADPFTATITHVVHDYLHVMIAGPHTDSVRSGTHCSHSLAAPLKVYLPLLQLSPGEYVIIDERAGTDPVATGILKGVDMAIIVTDPTERSVRVATQIAHELDIAHIPYVFAANKSDGDTSPFKSLSRMPVAHIPVCEKEGARYECMETLLAAM